MADQKEILTSAHLLASDAELQKHKPDHKWSHLASDASIEKAVKALQANTFKVTVVNNRAEALQAFLATENLAKSSYSSAGSVTLEEIGLTTLLKEKAATVGRNLKGELVAAMGAQDYAKVGQLQPLASTADVFVTSAIAVTEHGDMLFCDLTGSRVGGVAAAKHIVVIVGANKIVHDLKHAHQRMEEFALPMENARVRVVYKIPQSKINNVLEIRGGNPFAAPGHFHVIIVKEHLGY